MKNWQRKEKRLAEKFNGRRTPRSGGLWGFKGDVKCEDKLIESKQTEKSNFRITETLWKKIKKEALVSGGREPIFAIGFSKYNLDLIIIEECQCTWDYRNYETTFWGIEVNGKGINISAKDWELMNKACPGKWLVMRLDFKDISLLVMEEEYYEKHS
jgi:hypothetical protein